MNREKTALAVFALCIVLGLCALGAYIFVGHNWNIVASKVDDAASDMDGYYVLAYKGLGTDAEDEAKKAEAKEKAKSSKASKSSKSKSKSNSGTKSKAQSKSKNDADAVEEEKLIPVKVTDVVDMYQEKGAWALRLYSRDMGKYTKPKVRTLGEKRFGIVYFKKGLTANQMQRKVTLLHKKGVDYVVAFAPSRYYVRNVTDLDVVISLRLVKEKGKPASGPYYAPDCPSNGAGVVVINPVGVMSSKVLNASKEGKESLVETLFSFDDDSEKSNGDKSEQGSDKTTSPDGSSKK